MRIGYQKKTMLKSSHDNNSTQPERSSKPCDDIPRPRLKNITQEQIDKLRMMCNEQAHLLLSKMSFDRSQVDPDQISRSFAKMLVDTPFRWLEESAMSYRPRSRYTAKLTAEIRTIHKARNIIRALFFNEIKEEEIEDQKQSLHRLLDRLIRMDLASVPTTRDIQVLHAWSEKEALSDIAKLKEYAQSRKKDLLAREKLKMRKDV